jgi:hypothetical protein
MSALGAGFKATVVLPNGTVRPLLWVHDYDQNRQIAYLLEPPLTILAGSRIRIAAEFDNFETNPRAVKGSAAKGAFSLTLEAVASNPIRVDPRS